ncbi:MAG: tyrosine protein kinase, partial [Candidatus Helarchaeota archaeon]|nr:tyrosine protein kinase [Candidatus Helarchaeota archaeon]
IYLAYSKAKLIHGDLSEYNILITPELDIVIIDWPQWVPYDHPNFKFYLKRDISNILKFFKRKYDVFRDENEIFKEFFNP